MKRQLFIAVGLLSTLGLAVAAPTEKSLQEQGVKPLSNSELKELLQVRMLKIRSINGTGFVVWTTFQPDGSAVAEFTAGSNTQSMPGRVNIRDGQGYCAKWGESPEYCLKWYKTGDKEYTTFKIPTGEFSSAISLVD